MGGALCSCGHAGSSTSQAFRSKSDDWYYEERKTQRKSVVSSAATGNHTITKYVYLQLIVSLLSVSKGGGKIALLSISSPPQISLGHLAGSSAVFLSLL